MSIKEEIRNYQSKEEVEKDYERYKEEWRYNVEEESGVHKTGIGLRKVYLGDGLKMEYRGYDKWREKMRNEGLTDGEIGAYLRMLKNQFIVMNEMNPHEERELTLEERVKIIEKNDEKRLKLMREYHHFSEEELSQIAAELKASRERMLKDGGR